MKFGTKLQLLRTQSNIDVKKLAELLNLTIEDIEAIENGTKNIAEFDLSVWLKMLVIFNIKHEDLLNDTDISDLVKIN